MSFVNWLKPFTCIEISKTKKKQTTDYIEPFSVIKKFKCYEQEVIQ